MKYQYNLGVIKQKTLLPVLVAIGFALTLLIASIVPASAASTTETVTGSDVGVSWFENDTRDGGNVNFVDDATSPLGGALEITTTDAMGGSGQAKAQLFNYDHIGTSLVDVEEISYAEFRDSASTNSSAQKISLNIEVDYIGDGSSYTTLVFEPVYNAYQQPLADNVWQTWDAYDDGDAVWWSTKSIPGVCAFNCFVSWDTIVANNPDAKIIYAIGVNAGSGWNGDFSGRTDALAFNDVVYDFEPDTTPPAQVEGVTIFQNGEEIGCEAYINERTITVDWDDSEASDFDHYIYQADDGVGSVDFTTTTAISERTGNIRNMDGTYQYRVAAVDENGNQSVFSEWCFVTLDREAPVVDITSHTDGDVLQGTVDVRGSVEDDNPHHYYAVVRDSDGDIVAGPGTVFEDTSFINELLFEFNTTLVPDGDYTLWLAARDAADNRDNSVSLATVEVVVNNIPDVKGECKRGGWQSMIDHMGNTFKNQGDCVSYVATDGRNLGNGN